MEQFSRTKSLLGGEKFNKLVNAKVAVFGIGGVGGYTVEALARSGIGQFLLVDSDEVSVTNINRQIIALNSTVGRKKVDVMKERILDINPQCKVEVRDCFFLPENEDTFDFSGFDYIVDAVDTVAAKISIIKKAKEAGIPVISSMGAGNKLDPVKFQVADISKTSVCPLARVMRQKLKKMGIKGVKVVFSTEESVNADTGEVKGSAGRTAPASCAFVPSVAGLIIAGEVVRELANSSE